MSRRCCRLTGNLYYLHVATLIGVYWVLIATLNLLVGYTGQLSVGHVGLLAIGAYAFCILAGEQGWNPFLALLAGGAICALIGLLLGLPSLRLPGFYFAMVTLAFGLIVSELALAEQWLTNGSVGMPAPSFPAPFDTPQGFYWLVLGIAGFVTWLSWNLARLMWGRAMVAVRDSTVAAPSVAVPIYRTKLIVFVFSGFTAGIAGGAVRHVAELHHAGRLHPESGPLLLRRRSSSAAAASSSARSSAPPCWLRSPSWSARWRNTARSSTASYCSSSSC